VGFTPGKLNLIEGELPRFKTQVELQSLLGAAKEQA
jgi:hypothetical protein